MWFFYLSPLNKCTFLSIICPTSRFNFSTALLWSVTTTTTNNYSTFRTKYTWISRQLLLGVIKLTVLNVTILFFEICRYENAFVERIQVSILKSKISETVSFGITVLCIRKSVAPPPNKMNRQNACELTTKHTGRLVTQFSSSNHAVRNADLSQCPKQQPLPRHLNSTPPRHLNSTHPHQFNVILFYYICEH